MIFPYCISIIRVLLGSTISELIIDQQRFRIRSPSAVCCRSFISRGLLGAVLAARLTSAHHSLKIACAADQVVPHTSGWRYRWRWHRWHRWHNSMPLRMDWYLKFFWIHWFIPSHGYLKCHHWSSEIFFGVQLNLMRFEWICWANHGLANVFWVQQGHGEGKGQPHGKIAMHITTTSKVDCLIRSISNHQSSWSLDT